MFVPGKPFQPSPIFGSKAAAAYPSEGHFRWSPLGLLALPTRLVRFAKDKHSGLFWLFV
jgi:hypothetical protein